MRRVAGFGAFGRRTRVNFAAAAGSEQRSRADVYYDLGNELRLVRPGLSNHSMDDPNYRAAYST